MIITCSYRTAFIYQIFIMHAGYVGTKYVWMTFYYYIRSYNLCTTGYLIEYFHSLILQTGHPKCLPEFTWTDHPGHPARACFLTVRSFPTLVYTTSLLFAKCGRMLLYSTPYSEQCHWEHVWHPKNENALFLLSAWYCLYAAKTSPAIWHGH